MDVSDRLKKKLHTALKLCGFNVRREFCGLIVEKFENENLDLGNNGTFDECVKNLCSSLGNQCLLNLAIDKEHINQALEVCLHSGYDKTESVFSVIKAFDFPRLSYNPDRKQFFIEETKGKIFSDADSKAELFLNRYNTILQRTKRNFLQKISNNEEMQLQLQTIDFLLTLTHVSLNNTLILGSLLQVSEGKYFLEDPTGIVQLDLAHAVFYGGLFVENSFVLVNGHYEDKLLKVSTIILPPGEEYEKSRPAFGSLNYFGGPSSTPLRDSVKLREHLQNNTTDSIMFLSDLWLDHPMTFEKLETLFEGLNPSPPVAFVFMGNFMYEGYTSNNIENLKKLFKHLAELISQYANLVSHSNFVFVPGLEDPCNTRIVPRLPLPSTVTQEMALMLHGKAIFTTNPCRIQYCTREITVFRADVLPKLLQGSLHKPPKTELADNVTRTIIGQGHLSPMPLNALTVHWDLDYTLNLYPLPDLVVIGDKAEAYQGEYKNCKLINPGPFCESGFQFKCYTPALNTIDDCVL